MWGQRTDAGERHNNDALVPTAHTVDPKYIQQ